MFYFVHIGFALLIILLAILHGATAFAIGGGIWISDLLLRYAVTIKQYDANIEYLSNDVIRITIPHNFEFQSLQYCFIMIPAISHLEYHVSISHRVIIRMYIV